LPVLELAVNRHSGTPNRDPPLPPTRVPPCSLCLSLGRLLSHPSARLPLLHGGIRQVSFFPCQPFPAR
jgi:hypothetical protein